MSPTEAYKNIYKHRKNELKENVVFLDVRTSEEYGDGHAPGTINVDHMKLFFDIKKYVKKFKDKTLYVICHSGVRSELITSLLTAEKVNAINVLGGMDEWESEDLPQER